MAGIYSLAVWASPPEAGAYTPGQAAKGTSILTAIRRNCRVTQPQRSEGWVFNCCTLAGQKISLYK